MPIALPIPVLPTGATAFSLVLFWPAVQLRLIESESCREPPLSRRIGNERKEKERKGCSTRIRFAAAAAAAILRHSANFTLPRGAR